MARKPRIVAGQTVLPGVGRLAKRRTDTPGQKRGTPEADEQAALIRWARLWANHGTHPIPALALLHSSLNGVRLTPAQASKAKAGGMVAGVWDLFLPVPQPCVCGLWLEMKSGRGRLSPEQAAFRAAAGDKYCWAVCRTWHFAAVVILQYMGTPRTHPAWSGLEETK